MTDNIETVEATELLDPLATVSDEELQAKAARALLIAEGVDPDAVTSEDIERIADVTAERMLLVGPDELSEEQKAFKSEREHSAIVHLIAEGIRVQFANEYRLREANSNRNTKYKAGFQDGVLGALNSVYTKLINMLPEGYLEEYQAFIESNAVTDAEEGETHVTADTDAPVSSESESTGSASGTDGETVSSLAD
jgi:hypothetical protein